MQPSTRTLALFLIAGATGLATAQPMPPQPPPEVGPMEPEVPAEPPPPPPPEPARQAAPPPQAAAADRPEGLAFGIGIGYLLPTSVQTPNITSVRLRLATGLTFEPTATLSNSKETMESGGLEVEDSITELGLATVVRIPVIRHGKVELEGLGSIGVNRVKNNPEGPDNSETTISASLGWGLAVSYWLSRHWNLSISAANPLISYAKTSNEQPAPGTDQTQSTTTIAATFDPRVFVMIHLFN